VRSKKWFGALCLLSAVVGGCDDPVAPPVEQPVVLAVLATPPATGTVGDQVTASVVARRQTSGAAAVGIPVSFRVESGGGAVSAASVTTDANGRAEVTWTLGPTAGDQALSASLADQTQTVRFLVSAQGALPARITIQSGNAQTGTVGALVRDTIVARVTDRFNNPRPGVFVTLQLSDPSGLVAPNPVVTDANGVARIRWTLGNVAGQQRLTLRADTASAVVTATAAAGTAVIATIQPPASIVAGDSVHIPVVARDLHGNPITGRAITWLSTDTTVAVFTANGALRARTAGTLQVRATIDGILAVADITVQPFRYSRVAAGANHTCGIGADGRMYCWGAGATGALGTGNTSDALVPTAVGGTQTFSRVVAHSDYTCAIGADTRVYCWGSNNTGQLGNGTIGGSAALTPTATNFVQTFREISAGLGNPCGVTLASQIFCWGGGNLFATDYTNGISFQQVAGGAPAQHACGLAADGQAYCWGRNTYGQLGNGSVTDSSTPVAVVGPRFGSIVTGDEHTCGISFDGDTYCWGRAQLGQLGNPFGSPPEPFQSCNSSLCRMTPTLLATTEDFTTLTAKYSSTCGITGVGETFCWGADNGQLGNTVENECAGLCQSTPTQVETPLRFTAVSLGERHACAIANAGDIWCWGQNDFGQLGRSTRDAAGVVQTTPLQVWGPRR
jgi:alpha-tubulin suppressor-like RCC1 family protein